MLENYIAKNEESLAVKPQVEPGGFTANSDESPLDDRTKDEIKEDDTKLYDISNFSI